MALGSICEFPGNHENKTFHKRNNCPTLPHTLPIALLSIANAYLGPVDAHCLSSSAVQFLPVELGSPAVVLLLRILHKSQRSKDVPSLERSFYHLGVTVVASEEGESLGVASKLHLAQLLPCPIRVKVSGSEEGKFIIRRNHCLLSQLVLTYSSAQR